LTHIRFCDCLRQLLADLGISSSRLAKAINVDSSLVNRWINGKRIPSYHTDYIEKIADYLYKNIHNTFQEQLIHTLTADVCGSIAPNETLKDQIQFLLQEAQGYSMECAQSEKTQAKKCLAKKLLFTEPTGLHHDIFLSDNDRLLTDQFQITKACLTLLDTALSTKKTSQRTIYIVYDNHFFPDLWKSNDIASFLNKLKVATHSGFQIVLLIRLNYDTSHTVLMMEFIKPFLLNGTLTLYYVPQFSYTVPEQGLLLIPDVGLISGLSNEFIATFHYALYFTRPAVLNLCQSHLELFLK
jgi:transcriptional regulator with XRE-family HTH domain